LPELQTTQLAPAVPQALALVPGAQLPPLTHPVQQLPATHVPPVHAVPSVAGLVWHLPAAQLGCSQGSEAEQLLHATPPWPQAPVPVPALQLVPLQHPVQHLPALQVPAPLLQEVPAAASLLTQLPAEQLSVVQSSLSSQSAHASPAAPHLPTEEPV
jgi:hypothetical protein